MGRSPVCGAARNTLDRQSNVSRGSGQSMRAPEIRAGSANIVDYLNLGGYSQFFILPISPVRSVQVSHNPVAILFRPFERPDQLPIQDRILQKALYFAEHVEEVDNGNIFFLHHVSSRSCSGSLDVGKLRRSYRSLLYHPLLLDSKLANGCWARKLGIQFTNLLKCCDM